MNLPTIAKNLLKTGLESFKQLSGKFIRLEAREVRLIWRMWAYPYEYRDSWDKLNEQQLPPKEAFNSKLADSHITDEDYEYAHKVWSKFKIPDESRLPQSLYDEYAPHLSHSHSFLST